MSAVLHAVRIKGVAPAEAVAIATGMELSGVEAELGDLAAADLALERPSRRRPGWVLTEQGRERHAEWLAETHDDATVQGLDRPYADFLAVNGEVKGVAARWQAASGDAERIELVDAVEELHGRAAAALTEAATAVERFGRYRDRLATALERLDEDPSYFVGTQVDSYHNVWFECHEDFLVTLGRTRAEEGSE